MSNDNEVIGPFYLQRQDLKGDDIVIPTGVTSFGRGPFLKCKEKKVSRNHGLIQLLPSGNIFITATNVLPLYLSRGGSGCTRLAKDDRHRLQVGDEFSLLPDAYRYRLLGPTQASAAAKQPAAADEPAAPDKPAVADKPAAADQPAAADKSAAADKPEAADQPAAADQATAADQGDAVEEPGEDVEVKLDVPAVAGTPRFSSVQKQDDGVKNDGDRNVEESGRHTSIETTRVDVKAVENVCNGTGLENGAHASRKASVTATASPRGTPSKLESAPGQEQPNGAVQRQRRLPAWMLQQDSGAAGASSAVKARGTATGKGRGKRAAATSAGESPQKRPAADLGPVKAGAAGTSPRRPRLAGGASPGGKASRRLQHRVSASDDSEPEHADAVEVRGLTVKPGPGASPTPAAVTADGVPAGGGADTAPAPDQTSAAVADPLHPARAASPTAGIQPAAASVPSVQPVTGGDTSDRTEITSTASPQKMAARNAQGHDLSDDDTDYSGSEAGNPKPRESCGFGAQCYRKNVEHRRELAHPGDADYRAPQDPASDALPECQFGLTCYRKNPQHWREFRHTVARPNPGRAAKRKAQKKARDRGDDSPTSSDEAFINDSDSDDYDPGRGDESESDWSPGGDESDEEDRRRARREARRITGK